MEPPPTQGGPFRALAGRGRVGRDLRTGKELELVSIWLLRSLQHLY